jgi:hypothetical protein
MGNKVGKKRVLGSGIETRDSYFSPLKPDGTAGIGPRVG